MKIFQHYLMGVLSTSIYFSATAADVYTIDADEFNQSQQILIESSLNQALNGCLKQINQFKHSLEYLALLVHASTINVTEQEKKQVLEYVQNLRQELLPIGQVSFLVPEPQTILILQDLIKELYQDLKSNLNRREWKHKFSLNAVIKRRPAESKLPFLDLVKIQDAQNQSELDHLNGLVERFGLTKTQKIIRNLEDTYQRLCFKIEEHKLQPYLKYAGIGALLSAYVVYRSDYFAGSGLKKIIGSAPQYDASKIEKIDLSDQSWLVRAGQMLKNPKYDAPLLNADKLGWLGQTEHMISQNFGIESSPRVFLPGIGAGWISYRAISESRFLTLGLGLYASPFLRTMAITNGCLQITNDDKFKEFTFQIKDFLKRLYHQVRGKSNENRDQKPTVTFKDVIGAERAKKAFEAVVEYVLEPEKFERTKLTPVRGYLMVGPPRTGKSHIAKAICGEINKRQELLGKPKNTRFVSLDADLINENNFYRIMASINNLAPCVVFIDEIDLLCLNRGDGNKENRLLSQLLTHMSGYIDDGLFNNTSSDSARQVIFIAATNNPHSLDQALLQPGRFGKIITFDYPSLEERQAFLTKELKKRAITEISQDFIYQICSELEGHSFDDLYQVMTCAIQKASSEYTPVSEAHFRSAIEENIKAILSVSQSSQPSPQELKIIASHQAGKALATKLLTPSDHISTITTHPINLKFETKQTGQIITTPTLKFGDVFTYRNRDLLGLESTETLLARCQIMLSGHIAQELLMGTSCYSYRPEDQQAAFNIAKQIALKGANYSELTDQLQQQILEEAYQVKIECSKQVKQLLSNKLSVLQTTWNKLTEKGCLSGSEFDQLIEPLLDHNA